MPDRFAKAFWLERPGQGAIRQEALPEPGPGDTLVRTRFSGVSRGTENLIFQGNVPPSQYQTMRAPFQQGGFPGPVKYGYSSVGIVEAGPDSLVGKLVFCLHPHQDRYVVPADALVAVPDGVPAGRAVLAANMETALNGIWDAKPSAGDRIAVVGAGVVGCLFAYLAARVPGVSVQLIDIDHGKADIASALSVDFAAPDAAMDNADLVVEASGTEAGLVKALSLAGFEATVLVLSWFGGKAVTLPLGEDFHAKRLVLRSSQVGSVPADRRARWTCKQRLELALTLLADPALDILISGEVAFRDLPDFMPQLNNPSSGILCQRVIYE